MFCVVFHIIMFSVSPVVHNEPKIFLCEVWAATWRIKMVNLKQSFFPRIIFENDFSYTHFKRLILNKMVKAPVLARSNTGRQGHFMPSKVVSSEYIFGSEKISDRVRFGRPGGTPFPRGVPHREPLHQPW